MCCGKPTNSPNTNSAVRAVENPWKDAPCDVCVNVHNDKAIKKVRHCKTCGADICGDCERRYDLRIIAAVIAKFKKLKLPI